MAAQLDILGSKEPAERAEILRAFLEDARTLAGARILSGEGGEATCRSFASSLDVLAVAVYELARSEHAGGTFPRIVLLATGGWGRRETCPYSDIDLLVLTDAPSGDAVKALAERLLYPLWDAGVSVGHQVLSVSDARTLLAKDLPTATTLLDARPLAGDQELAMELLSDVPRALAHGDPNGFLRRLVEEKQSRHDRFGDSLYLLEPNLKQGQGALRDLATGLWAARARWRVNDFTDLVPLGQASARQVANLTAARELLLRVRAACHAIAKRRQDQLSFELQEAIAPKFFPNARVREGETRPAVAPAVEELMRRYYLVAKAVVRETDRLLDRAMVPAKRPPAIRRIDASFTIFNGHLSATDPEVFRQRPSEMVRLFRVALDLGLPIYGHTKELCAEIIAEEGASLAESDEAKRHFVLLLIDPRDNRQPSLLEEMHDLGILAALMPEFAPCTGRVQHDLYHVFTVDQHQLYAVALLKRIARGELQREAAAATEAIRLVTRPRALFLATLLHDVGKPLGKGHAEKGARLCAAISRRLGLSDEDVHQAEFLVRHHLLMSHLSQRRDLSDVGMVASFADTVRDEETLTELYLLTYCDTTMTAPGNLTEWKDTLQRELYDRTRAFFRRGPDLAGADRSALVKRRRRRVAELLGEVMDGGALDNVTSIGNQPARVARGRGEARRPEAPRPPARERGEAPRPPARERGEAPRPPARGSGPSIDRPDEGGRVGPPLIEARRSLARWFAGLPDRYFASLEPKTIVRHVRLSRSRGERPIAMEVKHHPRKGYSELALSAADAPGLLASITGVLLAHRIDILSAQIHSRAGVEDGDRGEALDVFFVRDRYGRGIPEGDPRWKRVAEDLARVAQGEPVEGILAARREKGSLNKRVTPEVTTEIEIDNRVSGDFTVIDVYTQDRLGILHAITRALTTQGLDICLSKVATEAERVADVFYVRDRESGQKVQDEERLACIREALVAALKEVKAS